MQSYSGSPARVGKTTQVKTTRRKSKKKRKRGLINSAMSAGY